MISTEYRSKAKALKINRLVVGKDCQLDDQGGANSRSREFACGGFSPGCSDFKEPTLCVYLLNYSQSIDTHEC